MTEGIFEVFAPLNQIGYLLSLLGRPIGSFGPETPFETTETKILDCIVKRRKLIHIHAVGYLLLDSPTHILHTFALDSGNLQRGSSGHSEQEALVRCCCVHRVIPGSPGGGGTWASGVSRVIVEPLRGRGGMTGSPGSGFAMCS